jgi:N-acetylglutamate synthase-like GNAT family acetyltransferase
MSLGDYRVRRATVDDLKELTVLWETMHFETSGLEQRLTDFQLVESSDGRILGGIALEVIGRDGRLHSEGFVDFSVADACRERLWERMRIVAANLGAARLWTCETAPFWSRCGLRLPDAAAAKKLPAQWSQLSANWLMIQFWDEEAVEKSLGKEFARMEAAGKAEAEEIIRRANTIKNIFTAVAIVLALVVLVISVYVFANRGRLPPPH